MNNQITIPPRQRIIYPTVAQVRKGKPKIKMESKDGGRAFEALAKNADLNQKFRIHFLPGTDKFKNIYHASHVKDYVKYPAPSTIPDGYEVEEINVIVTAVNIWSAWRYGNTANNAGREIARTDDTHYLTLRDPLNGSYLVRSGEPYKAFTPGDSIKYNKNGRDYEIKLKSNAELRIVPADMVNQGELVEFVLKTTSFYDCQQLRSQLAGIQAIANAVNGGSVAGIPLRIFRMEQEILWNHEDGSASRPKSWLINIQADPEWVKYIFSKMGRMALTGGEAAYLPAGPVQGSEDPFVEHEEAEDGEAAPWENGEVVEESPELIAARQVVVKLRGGTEKFLADLSDAQLKYVIERGTDPAKVAAARTVLAADHNVEI